MSEENGRTDLTWRELLDEGGARLSEAGVPDAGTDAWYLMEAAFGIDRVHYYLDQNRPIHAERLEKGYGRYQEMLQKRAERIPLQQILGMQDFMGMTFSVDENVLIPRQDTETLVERVLRDYPEKDLKLLDMCTGSGCIAISLAVLGGYQNVTAVDISEAALRVAKKNARRLFLIQKGTARSESFQVSEDPWCIRLKTWLAKGPRLQAEIEEHSLTLLQSNLFQAVEADVMYDVIVSNPPYIPSAVIDGLELLERELWERGTALPELLEDLSSTITETALCGLGQSACKPVQSTLKYFRDEYLAHVVEKHCPHCNGRKKELHIDPELCKGCGKCMRQCPMEAISGQIRMPHVIDTEKCIKCGACWGCCPFGAIREE